MRARSRRTDARPLAMLERVASGKTCPVHGGRLERRTDAAATTWLYCRYGCRFHDPDNDNEEG